MINYPLKNCMYLVVTFDPVHSSTFTIFLHESSHSSLNISFTVSICLSLHNTIQNCWESIEFFLLDTEKNTIF